MITLGWLIFSTLSIGYVTFVIWAIVLDQDILTEVNSRLPQDQQFPLLGRFRTRELEKQYRIFFPEGKLLSRSRWLFAAAFVCLFGAIATFSWFHLSVRR